MRTFIHFYSHACLSLRMELVVFSQVFVFGAMRQMHWLHPVCFMFSFPPPFSQGYCCFLFSIVKEWQLSSVLFLFVCIRWSVCVRKLIFRFESASRAPFLCASMFFCGYTSVHLHGWLSFSLCPFFEGAVFDPVRPYCDPFRSLVGVVRNCFLSNWVTVISVFFCIFLKGRNQKTGICFSFLLLVFFFRVRRKRQCFNYRRWIGWEPKHVQQEKQQKDTQSVARTYIS